MKLEFLDSILKFLNKSVVVFALSCITYGNLHFYIGTPHALQLNKSGPKSKKVVNDWSIGIEKALIHE